jgi:type II secretory pathway component PulM
MTDYTQEQRAIIARMGDASRRIRAARARHHDAHIATATGMNDAISALARAATALAIAIEQSSELQTLFEEHGDAFHEFLDTL